MPESIDHLVDLKATWRRVCSIAIALSKVYFFASMIGLVALSICVFAGDYFGVSDGWRFAIAACLTLGLELKAVLLFSMSFLIELSNVKIPEGEEPPDLIDANDLLMSTVSLLALWPSLCWSYQKWFGRGFSDVPAGGRIVTELMFYTLDSINKVIFFDAVEIYGLQVSSIQHDKSNILVSTLVFIFNLTISLSLLSAVLDLAKKDELDEFMK